MALKRANQPFWFTDADGVDHLVSLGDLVDEKDSIYVGREVLFDAFNPKNPNPQPVLVHVPDLVVDENGEPHQEGVVVTDTAAQAEAPSGEHEAATETVAEPVVTTSTGEPVALD